MRIAALADIHGNADALRAVLVDLRKQAVDLTVNLGDCLSGPLQAAETADLLMDSNFATVMGNHDRWLTAPDRRTLGWEGVSGGQLSPSHHGWVAALPASLTVGDVFLCHATPQDDLTYWLHHIAPSGHLVATAPADIAARLEGRAEHLFLCGHTHTAAAVQLSDGRMVVNPGSVGCPGFRVSKPIPHKVEAGTPFARYAILDKTGNDWDVTFRQVPYDTSRVVASALSHGDGDWASVLGTGWIDAR